jgi:uncharacterized protein (TIRG00374 family)
MKLLKNKLFLRALGLVIFLFILIRLDTEKTIDILSKLNFEYFLMALLLFIPHILFKIYRWYKILDLQKIKIRFRDLIHPYISSYGLGIVTPWKIGELTRIFYLKKKENSLGASAFSVVIDRILDVIFFLVVGFMSMLFLFSFFKEYLLWVSIILTIIAILILIAIYKRHTVFNLVLYFLIPKKIRQKTNITIRELWIEFKKLRLRFFIEMQTITALSWLFFYFEVYLFSIALNITLTLWQVIILVSIASITNLIPITISGIGTRDATFIFLFGIFGFSSEQALALSILILFMWIINALICMIFWWQRPIDIINSKKTERLK